jgi:hypothetical protein
MSGGPAVTSHTDSAIRRSADGLVSVSIPRSAMTPIMFAGVVVNGSEWGGMADRNPVR